MLLPDAGRGIFHRAALFQRVLEILLNVPDTGSIHHPDGIFKVMVQAAVVQIDGAPPASLPSTTNTFAWTKPGLHSLIFTPESSRAE